MFPTNTEMNAPADERGGMAPMIDVTFLLLIFFLCTLSFRSLEGKLAAYLPHGQGANPESAEVVERVEVRIAVRAAGRPDPAVAVQHRPDRSLTYRVGPRSYTGVDEVRVRIAKLHAADPTRPIALDAREGVVHGEVVEVVDAILATGFTELTFVGAQR